MELLLFSSAIILSLSLFCLVMQRRYIEKHKILCFDYSHAQALYYQEKIKKLEENIEKRKSKMYSVRGKDGRFQSTPEIEKLNCAIRKAKNEVRLNTEKGKEILSCVEKFL